MFQGCRGGFIPYNCKQIRYCVRVHVYGNILNIRSVDLFVVTYLQKHRGVFRGCLKTPKNP